MKIQKILLIILSLSTLYAEGYYSSDASRFDISIENFSDETLEFKIISDKNNYEQTFSIDKHSVDNFSLDIVLPAHYTICRKHHFPFREFDLGRRNNQDDPFALPPFDLKHSQSFFANKGSLTLTITDSFHHSQKNTIRKSCNIELHLFEIEINNKSESPLEFEIFAESDNKRLFHRLINPKSISEIDIRVELPSYYTLKKEDNFFTPSKHKLGQSDKWHDNFDVRPYVLKWDQSFFAGRGSLKLNIEKR